VVATAVNGCAEIVVDGTTGFLAPPSDVQAWADRVVELLNDRNKRVCMGQQGRRRVEQEFALQDMAVRLEQLYVGASCAATMGETGI
jgi:glycosyltransferase involved in cell wall biosynthesis